MFRQVQEAHVSPSFPQLNLTNAFNCLILRVNIDALQKIPPEVAVNHRARNSRGGWPTIAANNLQQHLDDAPPQEHARVVT